MQIVMRKISDLKVDPANANAHNSRNLEAIRLSFKQFGQQKPIVIDTNDVVRCGNGFYEAAKSLGETEIACVVTKLTGSAATAYAIADNKSGKLAEWNNEALAAAMRDLNEAEALATGFLRAEIEALKKNAELETQAASAALKNTIEQAQAESDTQEDQISIDERETSEQEAQIEVFALKVTCPTASLRSTLLKKLRNQGFECEPL